MKSTLRRVRIEIAAVAALLALVAPLTAAAQPSGYGLSTQVDPCVPIDPVRFANLLTLELDEAIIAGDDPRSLATIALTCAGDQIEVRLEDRVTRKVMSRRIEIQSTEPSARTRLMALTVAEFVLASWLEVRLFREEQLPPAGPAPPTAVQRRAEAAVGSRLGTGRALQLGAALETLAIQSAFQFIPCLGVRLTYEVTTHFAVRGGLQLGHRNLDGELSSPVRPVGVRTTLASLLAAVLYTTRFDSLAVEAGLGTRIGFASLTGLRGEERALAGEQSYAPWGGLFATAGIGYHVGEHARLALAFEAGYTTFTTRAIFGEPPSEQTVAELKGLWTGASLAFDWTF